MTSKLQVTIPKSLADQLRISPGDDIEWSAGGDSIRITPARDMVNEGSLRARLHLFDEATARLQRRMKKVRNTKRPLERDWRREDLYRRGRSD